MEEAAEEENAEDQDFINDGTSFSDELSFYRCVDNNMKTAATGIFLTG